MSIEKNLGLFTPLCDICGEMGSPMRTFMDAVNQKKENGWKSQKTGEYDEYGKPIWEDVCKECQGLKK